MSAIPEPPRHASVPSGLPALVWGVVIGALGGLIGLGGAEFRLAALEAVVVTAALGFRARAIPPGETVTHAGVVFNLRAGSLLGAWLAAGRPCGFPR